MKYNNIAICASLILAAQGVHAAEIYNKDANRVDFYGRVKAEHYFSDDSKNDGDKTYTRIGFKGQTQINDRLTGYGQWEYQILGNQPEGAAANSLTRLAFAGIKDSTFGSFDYGRNWGVLYNVEAYTDMLQEFGAKSYTAADNFMTGRANGVATWRDTDFFGLVDGLKVSVQYQGKNDDATRAVTKQNGNGYGTSLNYDIADTGLSVGAGWASSERTEAQENSAFGKGDKAQAWNTGIKYDANNVYLAATWAETYNMTAISGAYSANGKNTKVSGFANKTENFEAVAQYQFDNGLRPSIAWVQSTGKDIEGVGNADLVKFIDVSTTYYFNKNMSTFIEYRINQLDNNKLNLSNDNIAAAGLMYQF
ncbi:porin [Buttiauxella gaviniae]|uniref:Porin n=1 Tax=Buttiauxella gaviniae TaxID=82990 RepID=A0ABV3P068_9ENTR